MARTFLQAQLLYGLSLVSVLVSQSQTMVVRIGDTITLQCSNVTTAVGHIAWFKRVNGSEPVLGEDDDGTMYLLPLVVILGVVTDVLLIVILILVLKIIREAKTHNTGPDSQRQPQNDQNQDPDELNYAALNFTSKKRKMEKREGAGPPCSVCRFKMTKWRRMEEVEEERVRVLLTSCGVSDRKEQLSV
ncbi:unnamed protein product, partial [Coregonus sp. 'balchen']